METIIKARISENLKVQFEKVAKERGKSMSDLLREFIENSVAKATA